MDQRFIKPIRVLLVGMVLWGITACGNAPQPVTGSIATVVAIAPTAPLPPTTATTPTPQTFVVQLPLVATTATSAGTAPPTAPTPSTATPAISATPTTSATPTVTATPVPTYTYTVVNTYPHDRGAFTQGLEWDDGVLFEGTGLNGSSNLRKVELASGTVTQRRDLAQEYFGEGVTTFADHIYQLTWQSHVGFVYDKTTFAPLKQWSYLTEGWGLTHDNTRLIMSDGTARLRFLDPETLAEVGHVDVADPYGPVFNLNELEYVNDEIYANVWQTDRIVRIAPNSGQVLGWIDLTGLLGPEDRTQPVDVLNGIAYDAEHDRLFVTGKWWPKLFEIKLASAH